MDATARFARLLDRPESQVPLDEAALLIAAHAHPGLDVNAERTRLDDLAERCYAPTLDALMEHLFLDEGFAGNSADYYDPRNSFLNEVLDRRIGIPITLAVIAIEVGRRIGVPLSGVSLPGHFMLRDKVDPELFLDPFAKGARLNAEGCRAAFEAAHGPDAVFDPSFLEPAGAHAIIGRLLANLKGIYLARRDRKALAWVLRLRALVPGVPADERRDLASALAADGQFSHAAAALEELADLTGGELADAHRRAALHLRARLN